MLSETVMRALSCVPLPETSGEGGVAQNAGTRRKSLNAQSVQHQLQTNGEEGTGSSGSKAPWNTQTQSEADRVHGEEARSSPVRDHKIASTAPNGGGASDFPPPSSSQGAEKGREGRTQRLFLPVVIKQGGSRDEFDRSNVACVLMRVKARPLVQCLWE